MIRGLTAIWSGKLRGCIFFTMLHLDLWGTTAGNRVRFRSGSYPPLLPSEDFKERKTPIHLHKFSQESSCTEDQHYVSYVMATCPTGQPFASKCLLRYSARNFSEAVKHCDSMDSTLLQLTSKKEEQEYFRYYKATGVDQYWLGVQVIIDEFFWYRTGKKITTSRWGFGRPDNADGIEYCVEDTFYGWNDCHCSLHHEFYCVTAPFDPSPLRVHNQLRLNIIPRGAPSVILGELDEVTVTCEAYLLRFEEIGIKVNYEFEPALRFLQSGDECDERNCRTTVTDTYHLHKGRCVRKTTLKIIFDFLPILDRAKFNCYLWDQDRHSDREQKSGPSLYYQSQRPVLLNMHTTTFSEGALVSWTCQNVLATGGDVASVALISSFGCGIWIYRVNQKNSQQQLENYTKSKCAEVTHVQIHQRTRDRTQTQINIDVEAMVTGELAGATIACFSYDAMHKWEVGTLLDTTDPFAVYSNPIEVIDLKSKVPKLTVNYHAEDFTVYKNFDLTAYCDANVGEDGSILWTLKTKTKETKFAADTVKSTHQGIRIDRHPNRTNCPSEWTKNPTSETCVKILDDPYSWRDARQQCQSQGGDLAHICSSEGLHFMKSILGQDGYWIGLHDFDGDGHFAWWSNAGTEVLFEGDDWVRFEVKPKEKDNAQCVYMYNNMWYTHGCHFKLRPVCEIPPPPNIPLDGEFLKLGIGNKVRSVLTIKVNESLEGATLACQVTGPTIQDEETFTKESQRFKISYGPTEPQYMTYWEIEGGKRMGHIQCSGNVGSGGHLSLAIFSGVELQYLYVIGLDSRVQKVKPAPSFVISKLEVTRSLKKGPAMSVEALVTTSSQVDTPHAKCYSHAVSDDDHVDVDVTKAAQFNRDYKPPYDKESILAFGLLLLSILLFIILVRRKKDTENDNLRGGSRGQSKSSQRQRDGSSSGSKGKKTKGQSDGSSSGSKGKENKRIRENSSGKD